MRKDKRDVAYGSLGLIILKTLEAMGPLHGYRIARRIEEVSDRQLTLNQGTLYPALVKLEQAGWISAEWTRSDSGREVKAYSLTRAGRSEVRRAEADWKQGAGIIGRFLRLSNDPS
jgi:transcriptional regulator